MSDNEPKPRIFEPVAQIPRYRLVAQQIADRILDGALRPGDRLPPERELVETLGVSRATLREALIALEIAGFVANRFGAGMSVADHPPAANTLKALTGPGPFELLEARLIIEGEVAALAAPQIGPKALDRLRHLTDEMEGEAETEFWGDNADERFHLVIAEAAGNQALEMVVRDFWRQRLRQPMWVRMHGRVNVGTMKAQLVAEHRAIIAALADSDADAARRAMQAHIAQFARLLLDAWSALDAADRADASPPGDRLRAALGRADA
ncbi:FadR/GntR family transcriptional regulator [Oceanomicrobium pacificus]|uniref:FCD domain-containing protein n=1 Tax=Oceanomicrobium pacificus TaxID=2692916 RepID=A0A6B0TL24_9RHOB|nr:FadR/GntR family transcriptional regulator [Oceanomicrobium pacificus]MXU65197.1 FCD domain-containing protein [Oceanomicrobium pacificus]